MGTEELDLMNEERAAEDVVSPEPRLSVPVKKPEKELILITGSSGLIGTALVKRLRAKYRVIGLDMEMPSRLPKGVECLYFDLTEEKVMEEALEQIRHGYGQRIASVIHLAAYYSFTEKDSPKYDEINVKGTRKFLDKLQQLQVGQFIYSSSDLIYKPTNPGRKISEEDELQGTWGYPESKIKTERLVAACKGDIPAVFLRFAGVYTDFGHSIPITHQIHRIYRKSLVSHFYSGDPDHGNAFVHLDDVLDAFEKTLERRSELPGEIAINIGEPTSPTYEELQHEIGRQLYGKPWKTYEIPQPLAKAGAWVRDLFGDPFIKPWMVDRADDHYELDIHRAREYLDWEPKRRIMDTLPKMIKALKDDPENWIQQNNLN